MKQEPKPVKNCPPSKVARYQGKREPRCNGGKGCDACWDKFFDNQ